MDVVIGIDTGTTATKGIAAGLDGRLRAQTSVHYPPIHTFTQYRSTSRRELPRTDAVAGRILTLPLYGRMTDEQVDAVIEALVSAI